MSKHTPGPWMILDLRKHGEETITVAHKASPQAIWGHWSDARKESNDR